jgi:hypothetical protein
LPKKEVNTARNSTSGAVAGQQSTQGAQSKNTLVQGLEKTQKLPLNAQHQYFQQPASLELGQTLQLRNAVPQQIYSSRSGKHHT